MRYADDRIVTHLRTCTGWAKHRSTMRHASITSSSLALVNLGADKSIVTSEGQTALQLTSDDDPEIYALLYSCT